MDVPTKNRLANKMLYAAPWLAALSAACAPDAAPPVGRVAAPLALGAVPSQFIAKLYTEALGRAPDAGGWQGNANAFLASGCSTATMRDLAFRIFDSAEYKARGYSSREAVLTAYRAVLSREPDPGGLLHYAALIETMGQTPATVARSLAESPEFAAFAGAACAGAYREDWGSSQAIDIGYGTWTQARLVRCLADNVVCELPPRTVVYLNATLVVPAGHTLQTAGLVDRRAYARQARLVRASAGFVHMVELKEGATLRNVWVSGQRHLFRNALPSDGVRANVFCSLGGSAGAAILGNRLEFPLQRTDVETHGTWPLRIVDNLTVNYTAHHTVDGTQTWVSDGISNHHKEATIDDNDIVDPTDVGIVIFGHDDGVQRSSAAGNTIVHAGNSAYGSLVFDTIYECRGCQFTGAMHDNLILGGRVAHSDVMLSVGTGPWAAPTCSGAQNSCGRGARMVNNRTIWGDDAQRIQVQNALVVDGMLDADTRGNQLYIEPARLGGCFRGPGVSNDLSRGHASGSLMLEGDRDVHSCIGH